MRATRITLAAGAAVLLSLLLASATLASGPSASHRFTLTARCDGTTYTVVVPQGGQNLGAAQVMDAFGHAIPVYGTSSFTDITPDPDIFLGSWISTHGSGHGGQAQTECISIELLTASQAFEGGPLPEGVGADDTIVYEIDFWVVLKI